MEYLQFLIIIIFSPLLNGIIKKLKAYMQGRIGPGIFQPYFDLIRLFRKDMVVSVVASWIFKATPYIVMTSVIAASMIVPVITTKSPFGMIGDVIALIYILALGRFFMALAGLDTGTSFGGEGSSREMTVAILVEPMMMLSIFTAAVSAGIDKHSEDRRNAEYALFAVAHPCPVCFYRGCYCRDREDPCRQP